LDAHFKKPITKEKRLDWWKFVISSDSPFAIFDNEHFWKAAEDGESLSRKAMMPYFQELKEVTEREQKFILDQVECVCFTCDGWTSKRDDSHTTVTVHWLSENFVMCTVVLGAPNIPGSCTGVAIAGIINARLESFGIMKDRVSSACLDRGANYQKAIRDVYGVTVLDCICHGLNHVMEDVEEEVFSDDIVWVCRLVDVGKNNATARRAIADAQLQANRPLKTLKRASKIRWAY
jgi:hypothetical protein